MNPDTETARITPVGENFFADLGFEPAEVARILSITRPRVSDLVHKKTIKFTIEALVDMLARAGKHVQVMVH